MTETFASQGKDFCYDRGVGQILKSGFRPHKDGYAVYTPRERDIIIRKKFKPLGIPNLIPVELNKEIVEKNPGLVHGEVFSVGLRTLDNNKRLQMFEFDSFETLSSRMLQLVKLVIDHPNFANPIGILWLWVLRAHIAQDIRKAHWEWLIKYLQASFKKVEIFSQEYNSRSRCPMSTANFVLSDRQETWEKIRLTSELTSWAAAHTYIHKTRQKKELPKQISWM